MNLSDIIGIGLLAAALVCLHILIFQQYVIPHFGECYTNEQSHEHCTLFGIEVITVKEIQ